MTVEAAFADQIRKLIQRSGTRDQIRHAAAGRTQVADRAAQVALIGQPAPEIDVAEWVLGQPTTLAQLRGRVVLLEFWAYSCRPFLTAFPLLNGLHDSYGEEGLTVLALTRYVDVRSTDPSAPATRTESGAAAPREDGCRR